MEKELINEINDRHARNVDKWYRMFHNFGSQLVEIDKCRAARWIKDDETTALQFAESYKKIEPELRHAKRFHVSILKRGSTINYGFVISKESLADPENLFKKAAEAKEQKKEAEPKEGIQKEYAVFEGAYAADFWTRSLK
jgi:hypothetical protein